MWSYENFGKCDKGRKFRKIASSDFKSLIFGRTYRRFLIECSFPRKLHTCPLRPGWNFLISKDEWALWFYVVVAEFEYSRLKPGWQYFFMDWLLVRMLNLRKHCSCSNELAKQKNVRHYVSWLFKLSLESKDQKFRAIWR